MSKKQFYTLFLCSLIPWIPGNGLLPLLPVYASTLGATPALVGYYLAFAYCALVIGTLVAGWFSDRWQKRKPFLIMAGVANLPCLWLMGQVANPWQLAALTAVVWFLGGVTLTLIGILAGLFAEPTARGKVFGMLALTSGLGALIGGLTVGRIADQWGYPTMFLWLALFSGIGPIASLLLEDKPTIARAKTPATAQRLPLSSGFYFLIMASVVASIAIFAGRLGTSLSMRQLGFLSANIASTAAIGGLVTLPLSPLLGRLSDQVGRKRLLVLCYLTGGGGLLLLAIATHLWHFWCAVALLSIASYVGNGIGSAFAADLLPKELLGRGISAVNATNWLGGIIGFAVAGNAIGTWGMQPTLIMFTFLLLIAIVLLLPISQTQQGEAAKALKPVEMQS